MIALKTGLGIWQCYKKLGKEIWQWFLNCPENMMALRKLARKSGDAIKTGLKILCH
jgi:hypothetical protein